MRRLLGKALKLADGKVISAVMLAEGGGALTREALAQSFERR